MGLKNRLVCALFGHDEFNTGTASMPRIFQSKDVGNEYRDIKVCNRCDSVFVVRGILTEAELAEEAEHDRLVGAMKERMERMKEETIKRLVEGTVKNDGKVALN